MSFDSGMMRASVLELRDALDGARISRVYQPHSLDLVLRCHGPGGRLDVLLSADPAHARIHLTRNPPTNPPEPPAFCMLVRKRLENGFIQGVYQDGLERVAVIFVESIDDLGDPHSYLLVTETMGRHSNVILVESSAPHPNTEPSLSRNPPQGTVVDSIKRVTHDMSRVRQVLPGLPYAPPPAFDRPSLAQLNHDHFIRTLQATGTEVGWRAVLSTYLGLSPVLVHEFLLKCGLDPSEPLPETDGWTACIYQQLETLRSCFLTGRFPLQAVYDADGYPVEFAGWRLANTARQSRGQVRSYTRPSELLDDVYLRLEEARARHNIRKWLLGHLKKATEALNTRRDYQLEALARAEDKDKFRVYGELVTANLYRIEKGDRQVEVTNWYDPEQRKVTIELDPSLEPSANAQRLFRRYNKLKRTEKRAAQELRAILHQLDYLADMEYLVESAEDAPTLESLEEELRREGIVEKPKKRQDRPRKAEPYRTFRSSEGHVMYAGKNSRGNDLLATRLAQPEDVWLHAKDMAGSHVIVRMPPGSEPADVEDTVLEAAQVAAYYSKGRASSNVPIDYTLAKHVRKPKGARPGMVIYDHQQTLWVTPERELVESLRVLGPDQGDPLST